MKVLPLPSLSLSALRERTQSSHRRLEARLGYLVGDALPIKAYRRLLAAMLGFHAPLERRLSPYAEWMARRGVDLAVRKKTDFLRRDLISLGLSTAAQQRLPDCEGPQVGSAVGALGCLYVTEGATLGGRVISAALTRSLHLGPDRGAAFFAGYGEATVARWREVLAALGTLGDDEVEPAVVGAAAVFQALEAWLAARGCLS